MNQAALKPPNDISYVASSPDLTALHEIKNNVQSSLISSPSEDDSNSDGDSDGDLLDNLNKIDLTYRDIQFKVPNKDDHVQEVRRNYRKRISFDTVNIEYCGGYDDQDSDEDLMYDGGYGGFSRRRSSIEAYDFSGRGRSKSRLSPNVSPMHSPSASPSRGATDFMDMNRLLASKTAYRTDYPTSPIITHKGCTFTKVHSRFEDLYDDKLNNKSDGYLRPVLPNRTVLVYISGRKHTWVALDWVLNKFIENGDTVVIIAAINRDYNFRRKASSMSSPQMIAKTPRMRLRLRHQPQYVKTIAKDIMTYAMEVINPNVIAKITIELAVGKTKDVLQEMYKLYEPNLVCTGAKPNAHISAPLRSWTSSKLSDRLVKNFPLPVIFTPAVNLASFESGLKNRIEARYQNAQRRHSVDVKLFRKKWQPEDLRSISSRSSVSSEDSYSTFDEITTLYGRYKQELGVGLGKCWQEGGYSPWSFSECLKLISDKSAKFCRDLQGVDPDFRGRGAKLARVITGSNSFGVVPYKTKSLLAPVEHSNSSPPPNVPRVSMKEMKRALLAKQKAKESEMELNHASTAPNIQIDSPGTSPSPTPGSPPNGQSLRFVNLETPSKAKYDLNKLHKSFSHADESHKRPILEPSKSQPMFTTAHVGAESDEKPKKKSKSKKKTLLKLLKGGF